MQVDLIQRFIHIIEEQGRKYIKCDKLLLS